MSNDILQYHAMVERAMRGVVREALSEVEAHGFPGNHHFYITFNTTAPGVKIPSHLSAQYPETMAVVLQHQFWGLEVDTVGFSVSLKFGGKPSHLYIPFSAITGFADPEVKFGLQFEAMRAPEDVAEDDAADDGGEATVETLHAPTAGPRELNQDDSAPSADVVPLDSFRKK